MGSFKKATKKRRQPKVAIIGPSGSGKTMWALTMARRIREQIAADRGVDLETLERPLHFDTEHGSGEDYAHLFEYDHAPIRPPYDPERLVRGLQVAEADGYPVVIIDSYSHFWMGEGGVREIVDASGSGKFSGWKVGTPKQNKGVNAMLAYPGAVIICMRAKTEYVVDASGAPKKVGVGPDQRPGIEYEPLVTIELDQEHRGTVGKSRLGAYLPVGQVVDPLGIEALVDTLYEWLRLGVEPEPPAADPTPASPQPGDADQPPLPTPTPAASTPTPEARPAADPFMARHDGENVAQRDLRLAYRVLNCEERRGAVAVDEKVSTAVVGKAVAKWKDEHEAGKAPWHVAGPAPAAASAPQTPAATDTTPAAPAAASGPSTPPSDPDEWGDGNPDATTATKAAFEAALGDLQELRPNAQWAVKLQGKSQELFDRDFDQLDDPQLARLVEEMKRLVLQLREKDRAAAA
jgi:energy-coupling factor transporter ATP-binding protein EcfA2